jgi:hypothetical protein
VRKQVGQPGNLLFDRSFAGRLRDGLQPLKYIVDALSIGHRSCFLPDLLCHQSHVSKGVIACQYVFWGSVRCDGNRPGHGFLRHPHLQRLKERRHPALDQITDFFDFLWTFDRAKQLR